MRVSVLDRARTRTGESDAAALTATVERAVRADALGLHRFWVAEHHAVPGIAGSAPAVLLAAIGARTHRIRLGTGGIMLPNHAPLVVAEQALTLESLFPGRVDLGLGGSLGFTAPVRRALGRTTLRDGEYAAQLREVLRHLHGEADVTARPRTPPPPVLLLAIRDGLAHAAELGLPAVIGGPVLRDADALATYARDFRPSPTTPAPRLIVSAEVSVADTEERARELLLPEAWAHAESRDVGEFRHLRPVEDARRLLDAAGERTRRAARAFLDTAIAGTAASVTARLTDLLERTGAEEVLVSVSAHDRDDVRRTDEALAALPATLG